MNILRINFFFWQKIINFVKTYLPNFNWKILNFAEKNYIEARKWPTMTISSMRLSSKFTTRSLPDKNRHFLSFVTLRLTYVFKDSRRVRFRGNNVFFLENPKFSTGFWCIKEHFQCHPFFHFPWLPPGFLRGRTDIRRLARYQQAARSHGFNSRKWHEKIVHNLTVWRFYRLIDTNTSSMKKSVLEAGEPEYSIIRPKTLWAMKYQLVCKLVEAKPAPSEAPFLLIGRPSRCSVRIFFFSFPTLSFILESVSDFVNDLWRRCFRETLNQLIQVTARGSGIVEFTVSSRLQVISLVALRRHRLFGLFTRWKEWRQSLSNNSEYIS